MTKRLYEITDDLKQIEDLFQNAVDENGEPRDLTPEEDNFLKECLTLSEDELKEKLEGYGKIIANLKFDADTIKAEADLVKKEYDRLSAKAKAAENRVTSLKSYILWAFDTLKLDKVKTPSFTVFKKKNPLSLNVDDVNVSTLDEKYITKSVSKSALQQAIKDGSLTVTEGGLVLKQDGELIEGLKATSTTSIQVR
jgi:hypothetical protein